MTPASTTASWRRSATCRSSCRRRSWRRSPGPPTGDPRPDWTAAATLAAGGWESMTRLARGDVEMGAGIAATNAPAIAARLRDVRAVIDAWLARPRRRGGPDTARSATGWRPRARRSTERGLTWATRTSGCWSSRARSIMADPGWLGVRREGVARGARGRRPRGARSWPGRPPSRTRRHKQVIPYLVLRDGERWFLMRRTRAGGDARLHDRWSIGVGGHLNPGRRRRRRRPPPRVGRGARGRLRAGRSRPSACSTTTRRPSAPVHVGVVYTADAAGRPVAIRETDKLTGSFATTAEVAAVVDGMETWSRLVFEALRRLTEAPRAMAPGRARGAILGVAPCRSRSRTFVRRLARTPRAAGRARDRRRRAWCGRPTATSSCSRRPASSTT